MKTLPSLIPVKVTGVKNGIAMVTPSPVQAFKNPSAWTAHARIPIDLEIGTETIYSSDWTRQGVTDTIGVYKSGLQFPNLCPATLAVPETDVLAEIAVLRQNPGNVQISSNDAGNIMTAITCDRYWFSIPFSKNHGVNDRAIGFSAQERKNGRNKAVIKIKKREYARKFARLNHLANGRWMSLKHVLMFNGGVGLALAGTGAFIGLLWSNEISGAVLSFATAVTGIVLIIIGGRGEAL